MAESGRRRDVAGRNRPSINLDGLVSRLQQETPLWRAFLSAHRRVVDQLSAQMLADHRLPLEWFDVLIHLAEVPDKRLRQRVLRDRLLLSESGVSRLLVRMEKAGLLERRPAGEDRRGVEVALTEEGASVLATAVESHLDLVECLFTDKLTVTDQVALDHILAKLDSKTESVED
jgi:DNA-binding MarR family transcriptional regulator